MKMRRRRVKEISVDHPVETDEGIFTWEFEDRRLNPEECYSQEELQSILTQTIAQLSPTYRTIFQLREVEGFSTEETALALDVSPTAVKPLEPISGADRPESKSQAEQVTGWPRVYQAIGISSDEGLW